MNVVTYLAIPLAIPHYTRTNTHNTPLAICVKIILVIVVWTSSFSLGSYFHIVTFRKQFGICYFAEFTLRCFVHRISDNTFTASNASACFGRTTFETRLDVQCSRNISSSAIRIFRIYSRLCGELPYSIIYRTSIQRSS